MTLLSADEDGVVVRFTQHEIGGIVAILKVHGGKEFWIDDLNEIQGKVNEQADDYSELQDIF